MRTRPRLARFVSVRAIVCCVLGVTASSCSRHGINIDLSALPMQPLCLYAFTEKHVLTPQAIDSIHREVLLSLPDDVDASSEKATVFVTERQEGEPCTVESRGCRIGQLVDLVLTEPQKVALSPVERSCPIDIVIDSPADLASVERRSRVEEIDARSTASRWPVRCADRCTSLSVAGCFPGCRTYLAANESLTLITRPGPRFYFDEWSVDSTLGIPNSTAEQLTISPTTPAPATVTAHLSGSKCLAQAQLCPSDTRSASLGTPAATLYAVWGSSAHDVWAVGSGGIVLHWNGTRWRNETAGTAEDLNGVWGGSDDDSAIVWAVGGNAGSGVIRERDRNAVWKPASISGGAASINLPLIATWGGAAGNRYIAGGQGLFKREGSMWRLFDGSKKNLSGLSGSSDKSVLFAIEPGPRVVRRAFSDSAWTQLANPNMTTLFALWSSPSGELWLAGDSIKRLPADADTATSPITVVPSPVIPPYFGVTGDEKGGVWTVGGQSKVHHETALTTGITADLFGIWAGDGEVYAVGANGTILRYVGP